MKNSLKILALLIFFQLGMIQPNFSQRREEHTWQNLGYFNANIPKTFSRTFLNDSIFIDSYPELVDVQPDTFLCKKEIIFNKEVGSTLHLINYSKTSPIISPELFEKDSSTYYIRKKSTINSSTNDTIELAPKIFFTHSTERIFVYSAYRIQNKKKKYVYFVFASPLYGFLRMENSRINIINDLHIWPELER